MSPTYERLALAVSRDDELLALLGHAPAGQAAAEPALRCRPACSAARSTTRPRSATTRVANWPAIEAELRTRSTQTNEAGRCAALLPVLAALPQPLALLEVGASAGLCLYPDRYAYRYGDHLVGSGEPVLECAATGMSRRPAGRRWCGGPAWI